MLGFHSRSLQTRVFVEPPDIVLFSIIVKAAGNVPWFFDPCPSMKRKEIQFLHISFLHIISSQIQQSRPSQTKMLFVSPAFWGRLSSVWTLKLSFFLKRRSSDRRKTQEPLARLNCQTKHLKNMIQWVLLLTNQLTRISNRFSPEGV